jgi:hypothetical protein
MVEVDTLTKDAWTLSELIMKLCNNYTVATIGTALTFAAATLALHNEIEEPGAGVDDLHRFVNGIDKIGNHFIDMVYAAKAEGREVNVAKILAFEDDIENASTTH